MPRRREVPKRQPLPDPKFGSTLLTKFINALMLSGKKSTAEGIVYGALDIIKKRMPEEDELAVFKQALENAKPMVHVKSRRVGGATYQVPWRSRRTSARLSRSAGSSSLPVSEARRRCANAWRASCWTATTGRAPR